MEIGLSSEGKFSEITSLTLRLRLAWPRVAEARPATPSQGTVGAWAGQGGLGPVGTWLAKGGEFFDFHFQVSASSENVLWAGATPVDPKRREEISRRQVEIRKASHTVTQPRTPVARRRSIPIVGPTLLGLPPPLLSLPSLPWLRLPPTPPHKKKTKPVSSALDRWMVGLVTLCVYP